ncbi:hypothetical protein D3C78_854920 [compost metagenome]
MGVEHVGGRQGDHTHGAALGSQLLVSCNGQLHFGTGSDQDQFRGTGAILQHVATLGHIGQLLGGAVHLGQVLTGEDQGGRAVMTLDGVLPGDGGLYLVTGAPGAHVRGQTQGGDLLDRLVSRAIFTQTDGVVGVDEDGALLHQGGHAQGVAGVLHEHQEGGAVGDETTVQGDAVHDGGHGELAHTVVNVVAGGIFIGQGLGAGPHGQVGRGQVGGTTHELGQQLAEGFQGVLGCFTGRYLGRVGLQGLDDLGRFSGPVGRQLANGAALELGSQGRVRGFIGGKLGSPVGFELGAFLLGIPLGGDLGRDDEGRVIPFQEGTGGGDLVVAQR